MTAKELFDAGQLGAAITQLTQEVKAAPSNVRTRTFLFELLCFAGDTERAVRQLDVVGQQSASAEVGVELYRKLLAAEKKRRSVFAGEQRPDFLFEPPAYTRLHLEALQCLQQQRVSDAKVLLEQSEAAEGRAAGGQVDGVPFEEFRDSDDVLGPFLEVFAQEQYIWLPFAQIRQLHIAPPKQLRDLMWIPAKVEAHTGPIGEVYLPVLYVASSEHPDDEIKLGRATDWSPVGDGMARGVGQRLFAIDGEERPILSVRDVEFTAST